MKNRFTNFLMLVSIFILIFISVSEVFAYEPGQGGTTRVITDPNLNKSNGSGFQVQGTSTAKVSGTDKGTSGIKFKDPYDASKTMEVWAGTFSGEVDGATAYFYCIDLKHPLAKYTSKDPHTYTDQESTSEQITYILNNFYPYVSLPYTGSLEEVKEAAAIQLVIWHYADGLDLSTISNNNELKTRALAIQAQTDANYSSFYPLETLLIVPTNQSIPVGTAGSFFALTSDASGNPLQGISVSFTTTSGTLSTGTATTGATGSTGNISLTQGASTSSVVTAQAHVKIPQGTKYVHTIKPNEYQKLVLATPAGKTRKVTANVEWYTPQDCDTKGFTTFTQGGWGSSSNSTPGKTRDMYFTSVFASGLVVGCDSYKLTLSTATAVKNFLPQGGTAGVFTSSYNNPTSTSAGVLAGQIVALKMNVMYDEKGYIGTNSTNLGDLVIASGTFYGMKVSDFLALAEKAIGGCGVGSYTFSQFNEAATAINENFDNGTTDNGYLICSVPKASIGDKVWLDSDKDGIQDSGENGIANVTVNLYTCADVLVATTTTDADGNYLFLNLTPGDYYVVFTAPSGYSFTIKDAGSDDVLDSDADLTSGKAICTTLEAGENDLTWDAGMYQACNYKIGDYIWHDKNVNGIQETGEAPIQGVVVELLQNDGVIATTITDAAGLYLFSDLCAGTYGVRVAESNYNAGGVLEYGERVKWYSTTKNQGNDALDSDADKNEIISVTITNSDNLTIDFGFYKTCVSLTKTANPATVKPGETITYTFTVENCGDIKLAGGVHIMDPLLNPVSPYLIKELELSAGEVKTFTKNYTATTSNCGELVNTATAEGHPQDGSAYVTDYSSATVNVNCQETCVDGWSGYFTVEGSANNAKAICELDAKTLTVTGHVDINPNPSKAYLQLTWRIVEPTNRGYDLTTHYETIEINGSTDFSISADWPGVKCDDQLVEVHYGVNVLDCNRNPIHNGIGFDYYWNPNVCAAPECDNADLELTKTVDNNQAKNGDVITYTITVVNKGDKDATGVNVKDVLPVGVEYQSHTASTGTYDLTSGIWTIGNLANGATATLAITVKVNVGEINNGTFDLGPAIGYNVFVLYDINQPSSDTEGKMAVGRSAELGGYSIGDKLAPTSPVEDVLIVGGNLSYTSGRVYNGNIVVKDSNSTNLPIYAVSIEEGELKYGTPIDFDAARAYLTTLSTTLSTYVVNGATTFEWGGLFLTGTNPYLNVFKVSGADLSVANNFEIDVPNGSVVLVNIDGQNVSWMGGLVVKGTSISNVLYNFYEANTLTIHGIDVRGAILAPFADLNFAAGVVNGQVIVKSMTGSGQFNNNLFVGNIPAETNVVNIAEISASAIYDPDSTPNNGVEAEDDYGKVVVNVTNDGTNSNKSGNNGASNSMSWESIGNVVSETVLTFTNDSDGNIITGTSDGKIYLTKDNGENWDAISTDLKAGAVWSLVSDNSGKIFASTKSGVYSSNDNGKTWNLSGLALKDVRSIVNDASGNLYAGVWGEGVYKSEDNGANWNEMNNGLENTSVQSLLVGSNDEILAATYGSGVSKYSSAEGKWTSTKVGNNFVWTLAKNSQGKIFAGTYGDGLYQLQDNDANWTKLENNLPAEYIYSITFDSNDKIYVSSLANGVFASENDGTSWDALGMGGYGVSSIIADKATNKVFAGTNNGKIYRSVYGVTDVNDNKKDVPTEFKLSQNYPNPFNPSTTIEFAVAKTEMVSLAIYDILGQVVKVLVDSELEAGNYNVTINAGELASGVYIYRLATPTVNISKKMVLQK